MDIKARNCIVDPKNDKGAFEILTTKGTWAIPSLKAFSSIFICASRVSPSITVIWRLKLSELPRSR